MKRRHFVIEKRRGKKDEGNRTALRVNSKFGGAAEDFSVGHGGGGPVGLNGIGLC